MHPRNIITVNSFGRCGSCNIIEHFESANYTIMHTHNDKNISLVKKLSLKQKQKIVIHNHESWFVFKSKIAKDVCFNILVKRKDQFAQLASCLLTVKLYEIPEVVKYIKDNKDSILHPITDYSNIIPQIKVEKELFLKKAHELIISEQDRLKTITESPIPYDILYYEDFISNLDSLKKYTPDVLKYKKVNKIKKSPLQSKILISNYDELVDWWKDLNS